MTLVTKTAFPSDPSAASITGAQAPDPLPFHRAESLEVAFWAAELCLLVASPSDY